MSHSYDPAKQAGSPLYHPDGCCCVLCGPGGNTTLIDNNEKGILETMVHAVPSKSSPMTKGSGNRQGIYTS